MVKVKFASSISAYKCYSLKEAITLLVCICNKIFKYYYNKINKYNHIHLFYYNNIACYNQN